MKGLHRYNTGLGTIQVAFDPAGILVYLGFADHERRGALLAKLERGALAEHPPAGAVDRLLEQLEAYAGGSRRAFSIPFRLHGTPFELRVWSELQRIPFGDSRSYGQLAGALGNPNLSRAVGRANGANPVSILVPCHRVIGASGDLTGYAGGLGLKERLLRLEGILMAPVSHPAGSR